MLVATVLPVPMYALYSLNSRQHKVTRNVIGSIKTINIINTGRIRFEVTNLQKKLLTLLHVPHFRISPDH